jgi:hypothetical protein
VPQRLFVPQHVFVPKPVRVICCDLLTGIWRGSTVAIKTMILPAKMSGAEKRERMAIMEAAISSTMAHPNIVQTYTYTIKSATSSGALPALTAGAGR